MNGSILIYDCEEITREALKKILSNRFPLITVEDRAQCIAALKQTAPLSLAFMSVQNEETIDLELFIEARVIRKDLTIIALGDGATEDAAVEAVKLGATGYMIKPLMTDDVAALAMKLNPGC